VAAAAAMNLKTSSQPGVWLAAAAYTQWGLLPVYWKWLAPVAAAQILCHRIVWSFFLLWLILAVKRRFGRLWSKGRDVKTVALYSLSGVLLGLNWFVYIWAVNAGLMVEASLGYFMNPLVNVGLGVFFFHEKMRPLQWLAFVIAAAGVIYLTLIYGRLPWIGLALAVTFGAYGLLRKWGPLNSLEGLSFETMILVPMALGYLVWLELNHLGFFGHLEWWKNGLLIGAGVVTTLPLLCFAAAARRIDLSLMGILQYIAPTLQFILGVAVYHEPFTSSRLTGFLFIWLALLVFSAESLWHQWQLLAEKRRVHALEA